VVGLIATTFDKTYRLISLSGVLFPVQAFCTVSSRQGRLGAVFSGRIRGMLWNPDAIYNFPAGIFLKAECPNKTNLPRLCPVRRFQKEIVKSAGLV
jgi:hypothetical protein